MNIIVKTTAGRCYCRPDTSWEREDKDLFPPESVSSLLYTPVLFARICKAGKCVSGKFAGRYYDSVGFGILIYAGDFFDSSELAYASASCLDHTSVLPSAMYGRPDFEKMKGPFVLYSDGREIYRHPEGDLSMIEDAISEASSLISLRIGDMVATELAAPSLLASRDGSEDCTPKTGAHKNETRGTFCGNDLVNFNIIF